jgi:hypothetical protein
MTIYNVHIFREMNLKFHGIQADTPEAAASITRGKLTDEADSIDDCDGDTLAALVDEVDVHGDTIYDRSCVIDFEPERQRKAAPALLAALKYSLEYLKANDDGEQDILSRIAASESAVAKAETAGIQPEPCKAAPKLLATLESVAALRRKWRSQDEAETIDSIEYMDGLDSLDLDAVIAAAKAAVIQPEPYDPTTVTTEMYDTLRYVAEMLSGFKPDFLRNIGLDVALEKTSAAVDAFEAIKA